MKRLLILILLLVTCSGAWATTYYLDSTSAGGDGTTTATAGAQAAFATIAAAEAAIGDGDTVMVKGGTVASPVEYALGASWTLTEHETWYACNSSYVHTNGAVKISYDSANRYVSFGAITGADACLIDGFVFSLGASANYCIFANNVSKANFTDCTFTTAGSMAFVTDAMAANDRLFTAVFTNCTISETGSGKFTRLIYSTGSARSGAFTFSGCTIAADGSSGLVTYDANATGTTATGGPLTITNSTISVTATATNLNHFDMKATNLAISGSTLAFTAACKRLIYCTANTSVSVTGSTISTTVATSDYPISIASAAGGIQVRFIGNTVTTTATAQPAAFSILNVLNQVDTIVSYNTFTLPAFTNGAIAAIQVRADAAVDAGKVAIIGNTINTAQTTGYCIYLGNESTSDGDNVLAGSTVAGNRITAPTAGTPALHDILVGFQQGCRVYDNYVYGGGYGIILKGGDWANFGYITNNLAVNQYLSAYSCKGTDNAVFEHNTASVTASGLATSGVFYVWAIPGGSPDNATGVVWRYNIINAPAANILVISDASNTITNCNYNCYWTGGAVKTTHGGTAYTTFAAAVAAGKDTNSINLNPQFVSAGKDFRVRGSSPCINPAALGGGAKMLRTSAVMYKSQFTYGAFPAVYLPVSSRPL